MFDLVSGIQRILGKFSGREKSGLLKLYKLGIVTGRSLQYKAAKESGLK